ncbi:hypothetical protein BJ170DRAFT_683418 [Xylariales sp. AK1849]|nr:hypothetical protein BJ170DRAFT_683418 [Xylariales sp. AK1849]
MPLSAMFRRLGSGIRWRAPQSPLGPQTWNRSTQIPSFTQRAFHQSSRPGHDRQTHKTLRAGVLRSAFFMSAALLLFDPNLDWNARRQTAIDLVQSVTMEEDIDVKLKNYWEIGPWLLEHYCEKPVTQHGSLPLGPDSEWRDQIETRVFSAPDPDDPEKTFVVCQVCFKDRNEPEFYVSIHGNLLTDVTEDILPAFEEVGKAQGINRGAILVLSPSDEWKSVYFDGNRYISVGFLEWQTAELMGFS